MKVQNIKQIVVFACAVALPFFIVSLGWAEEPEGNAPAQTTSLKPSVQKKKMVKKKKIVKASEKKIQHAATEGVPVEKKEASQKDSLSVWLTKMKKRLARTQSKHNQLVAVAAVRGDKATDATPLYWKGKTSEGPVDMPEIKAFEEAVDLASKGDNAKAKTKLEAFVSTYPQSPLVVDAQETLSLLTNETVSP